MTELHYILTTMGYNGEEYEIAKRAIGNLHRVLMITRETLSKTQDMSAGIVGEIMCFKEWYVKFKNSSGIYEMDIEEEFTEKTWDIFIIEYSTNLNKKTKVIKKEVDRYDKAFDKVITKFDMMLKEILNDDDNSNNENNDDDDDELAFEMQKLEFISSEIYDDMKMLTKYEHGCTITVPTDGSFEVIDNGKARKDVLKWRKTCPLTEEATKQLCLETVINGSSNPSALGRHLDFDNDLIKTKIVTSIKAPDFTYFQPCLGWPPWKIIKWGGKKVLQNQHFLQF